MKKNEESVKHLSKYYFITGRTKSNKYVCAGPTSDLELCKQHFLEKYPRFSGEAIIVTEDCQYMGNNIVMHNGINRTELAKFNSYKELIEAVDLAVEVETCINSLK